MKIHNLGKTRINIMFGDNKHKLYVTKYSTCDDVIHSIVSKLPGSDIQRHSLAVFEQCRGVERMLAGGIRILKIMRLWGCKSSNFELEVKRKSSPLEQRKEFCSLGGNSALVVDDIYKRDFSQKLSPDNNFDIINDARLSRGKTATMAVSKKVSESLGHLTSNDTVSGKQAILSRYISDVFTHKSRRSKGLGRRSNRDGQDENLVMETSRAYRNNSSHSVLTNACKKAWELETETDNDSDDESLRDSTGVNDFDLSFDNFSDTDEGRNELDTAFVKSTWDCDSDEGIDVTSINSGDLNTAFVGDVHSRFESYNDRTQFVTEYSFDVESSEISVGDYTHRTLNMNCTQKITFVKNVFQRACVEPEDDEMGSFMVSFLDDE